jgi:TonB family protein
MMSRFVLLVIPFTAHCASAGGGTSLSAQEAVASFCGRVVAVSCAGPSSAVTLQVAELRGSSSRWAVIPPDRRRLFGSRIEDRYDGQLVCIVPSAEVTAARERVLVQDPGQLVVKGPTQASIARPDDVYGSCDLGVESPRLVRSVYAQYTADAMRTKVRGSVFLRGIVDRNGAVGDVHVVQSLEPSLDEAARKAFAQWEFRPATHDGEPVAFAISVQMSFTVRYNR